MARSRPSPRHAAGGAALVLALFFAGMVQSAAAADGQAGAPGDGPAVEGSARGPQGASSFKPPTFADDTLMYVFGPAYRNPFVATSSQPDGADIQRNALEFKHVGAWKYGHNFIEVTIKKSSGVEPAAGGGTGAVGLYAIFRSGVGINRLAGRPVVAFGPIRDIDLQGGLNLETKNSDYAPQERTLYFGPNVQLRWGQSFVNVGLQLRKEWNHNGNLGRNESYDVNFNIEPVWHFPFRIAGARLAFDGFADYNTAKGKDAAGRDTRPEFITRPLLKLDISPIVGQTAHVLEAGVGFQYWRNMFGKDASRVPGADEFTPVVSLAVHLPLGGH